jgi:hypothetical protein
MRFRIELFEPFRVSTGLAARGVDDAADPDEPIPGSSLKGVMRRAAIDIGVPTREIDGVFGRPGSASPWSWSTATVALPEVRQRVRIAVDSDQHTVRDGALVVGHDVWAATATFSVDRIAWLEPGTVERHEVILLAAAHGVHSLGADRNRGMGWVGIACPNRPLDGGALSAIAAIVDGAQP